MYKIINGIVRQVRYAYIRRHIDKLVHDYIYIYMLTPVIKKMKILLGISEGCDCEVG